MKDNPNKTYIYEDGIVYLKMSDGRLWCPSRQARGTTYKIKEDDIKDKEYNDYRTNTFVAIDFETAMQKTQMPCQIGITVVVDGIIEESFSRYIQPPDNKYSPMCIKVHHITPDITENEPLFPDVWNDIKQYFEGKFIVAHNAKGTDITILKKALSYYNIPQPDIIGYGCTLRLCNNENLKVACYKRGIKLSNHHDAKFDSLACAQLYLHVINNLPILHSEYIDDSNLTIGNLFDESNNDCLLVNNSDVNQSPFANRNIYIDQSIKYSINDLKSIILKHGGFIKDSISKNCNYLIMTSPNESVLKLNYNGWHPRLLSPDDIDAILSGKFEDYYTPEQNIKNLNLTLAHVENQSIDTNSQFSPIARLELYIDKSLPGNIDIFSQITGNLAAFSDRTITNDTNCYVLSDYTVQCLKNGIKNDMIKQIEDYYNNSDAVTFYHYRFITANAILEYCKSRCERIGDMVTMELYNKYIQSIQT